VIKTLVGSAKPLAGACRSIVALMRRLAESCWLGEICFNTALTLQVPKGSNMERSTSAQRWRWSREWLPPASHPSEPKRSRPYCFRHTASNLCLPISRKPNTKMNPHGIVLTVAVIPSCIDSWQFALHSNCSCSPLGQVCTFIWHNVLSPLIATMVSVGV